MTTEDKGAWILLDQNIEELLLNGLPKVGDEILIYSYGNNPTQESLKASLSNSYANPEYIHADINKSNTALGA